MIGTGGADVAAQGAVAAFQAAGGTQMAAVPVWVALLDLEVGHRGAEVAVPRRDGIRLSVALLPHPLKVAAQDGGTLLGGPDGLKVFEDGAAARAFGT
jgi:hypothetical protein